ncbi:hypothetical protein PENSPDRAFT_623814 [Peniophora sp. CONT]|nr:hypothetical protein PENSPDRAFT_623814 [Peniophora sp. CONT]
MPVLVPVPESGNAGSDSQAQGNNALTAAIARTLARTAALYFSRPVRLFRPAKVSGWSSLKGLATRDGREVDARFIRELVNAKGLIVIPKHFIPPLVMNAALGVVLWQTYAEVSTALGDTLHPVGTAFLSGAIAGGTQAIVAAPAENIRLAIERGSGGWSHAWKEVFRTTQAIQPTHSTAETAQQARRVRDWMNEVGDMAGRGWRGWGWTLAKDVCGFSVFFAIFEGTRRVSVTTTSYAQKLVDLRRKEGERKALDVHLPGIAHGITLVGGGVCAGVAYEFACRPWDAARRLVHVEKVKAEITHTSRRWLLTVLAKKIADDGLLSLFRSPHHVHDNTNVSVARRRLYATLRTLGRVGPWGFGFLVWEAYGPGLGIQIQ